jgi:hypothetical protein
MPWHYCFSSAKLAERCIIVNPKMRTKGNIDGNKIGALILQP